ncbi:metal-sulfur cluster assembly factor [Metabacillus malikii]|uniref:Metal-sulfur cluster biosynthetic enzyme n=1 Tax=Metabacillus malikii TaxID=1504265 RepID=A0ABT9ZAJ6_9BACI|nr:metal-sulfur cluster assembly factor [Metabacillus malikii]MDQ0229276.1 metal-sulfur cluster biosynthetic enzyme [Metabacillus malikii]
MEKQDVFELLKTVDDPELGVNIVDLGLVYNVNIIETGIVDITMTLTTPGCPLHDSIKTGVINAVSLHEETREVHVNIVWEPEWTPDKMSKAAKAFLWG